MKNSFKRLTFLALFLMISQIFYPIGNVLAESSMLPPSNLAQQFVTPDDVKLTWSSVYGATGYNVYEITDGQLILLGKATTTSYNLDNLAEGSYRYVLSTLSADGESGPCAPVTVDIVYPEMTAPATLTNTVTNGNDITLSWGPSTYAEKYQLYQIAEDGQKTLITSTASRLYKISNAAEGKYTYAVSASHSLYGESPLSSSVQVEVVYPTMQVPANFTYSISNGNDVNLKWDSVSYATNYNLYQIINDEKVLKSPVTGTILKLTNMAAGEYLYEIRSNSDRFGESVEGKTLTVTVGQITMTAPSNFTYKLQNINDIVLTWGSVPYATNYKVYEVINGEKILKTTVTGTSITYAKAEAGDHTFIVHSNSDRFGESAEGSQVSLTVDAVSMEAPSNFNYKIQNGNDIVLNWDATTNTTNYKIYQMIDGQKVLKSTVTGTTVTFPNMAAGEYTYEVHSNSTRFGESLEGSQISISLVLPTMKPPVNLTGTVKNDTDITLTWDASEYVNYYKVYQVVNGQKILKTSTSSTSVPYTGLPPGDYTYAVYSYSSKFGESAEGATVTITLKGKTMLAPANPTYSVTNGNDVKLSWTAAENATNYKIYQIVNGEKVLKSTVSSTYINYTNLPGGDYQYEIHSNSSLFGESTDGAELKFTLALPTMQAPSDLKYTVKNGNDVVLNWTAVDYANTYKLYEIVDNQKVLKYSGSALTATIYKVPAGEHTYVVNSVSTRFGESLEGKSIALTMNEYTMGAPENLTENVTNINTLTLNWDAVTYANKYKVYEIVGSEKVLKSTVTTTTATLSNLTHGDHQYAVHSVSDRFGESPDGAEVSVTITYPTIESPQNLAYNIQNGNDIVLTWDKADYASNYKVYELVDGKEEFRTTASNLTTTFTNVTEGEHTYVVHTSSRFGESAIGRALTIAAIYPTMKAPENVTTSVVNGNDLTLKWDKADYANNYRIYQIIDNEKVLKSTVSTNSVTYVNLPEGDYQFEIHSYSSRFGESPEYSSISYKMVFPIMQAPENFTKTITNGNDLTLRWNSVTYATNYKLYQMVDGEKVFLKTVSSTSTSITNLPEGDYEFVVHSYSNRFGESPEGSILNFTLTWPVVQPPQLSGAIFNVNNITLTWPAVTWANEYRVYKTTNGNRELVYKGTALTYKVYNLTENTHSFEVTAYSTRFGESKPSNQITETIVYPVMQPPVANLVLLSETSARISWDFITYANGYNIYELIDGKPVLVAEKVNNLSYTVSNLTYANHLYYVTSYSNSFGESKPSDSVLAKLIVDTEAPVTTINAPTVWTNQSAVVSLSANDNETGVAATYYSLDGSEYTEGTSFTVEDEGIHEVSFYSIDKVGNKENAQTIEVKVDKTAPVTTSDAPEAWSKEDITVTLSAADEQSGVANTFYSINGSEYVEGTTFTVTKEGINKVSYYSVDHAGNKELAQTIELKVDKTAPVTTSDALKSWSKEDVTVNLTSTDEQSGVANTFYSINGSEYVEGTTFTVTKEGINIVSYYSMDHAGNKEHAQTIAVKVDKTAPVTTSDAPESWSKEDLTVNLTSTDEQSGVSKTFYSVNGSEYVEGTLFTFQKEGTYKVNFYSIDEAGNIETVKTDTIKIDKTAPIVKFNVSEEYKLGSEIQLLYTAEDNLSEVVTEKMIVSDPSGVEKEIKNSGAITLDKPGVYSVTIVATNGAGLSTTIQKQFVVYIPATVEVTPTVIKGNKGIFTVRVSLPAGYDTNEFNLDTAELNGVQALTSNKGYYNQAKIGQFKFERSDFNWASSEVTLTFRCYVNNYLVVGQTRVKVQK